MQRIRMSLPYFKEFGWEAEVVTVHPAFSDLAKDLILQESIPKEIKVHQVNALPKRLTSKFGLGSIALRSLWFYRKKVNQLIRDKKFDLIYFSTTQFPVCVLGAYWKKKFDIPYIIDMQDPWFSDYYQSTQKKQRPKKYWFSYRLNKYLEPIAMKSVGGLVSVSDRYIQQLRERYPHIINIPAQTITFGAFDIDFQIAEKHHSELAVVFDGHKDTLHLIYIGRGGYDMQAATETLFKSFAHGLKVEPDLFERVRFHFIGTSYAPNGQGIKTIAPIANKMSLSFYVTEYTDRIGFYQSLKNLKQANGLIIIGSDDSSYTASKLYPYILAKKPLLAIMNKTSSACDIITTCNAGTLIILDEESSTAYQKLSSYLKEVSNGRLPVTNWKAFEAYTSAALTKKQVALFNKVITYKYV